MKKILAILVLVLFGTMSYAQWVGTSPGVLYTTLPTGNVGIGIAAPGNMLDVVKSTAECVISARNLGGPGGATFYMYDQLNNGKWKFKSAVGGAFKIRDNVALLDVITIEQSAAANALYIKAGGNVGIGTTNPSVKLAVNGKINCKEVEVTLTGWSDYVFKDGYNLKPLYEVESYINENKHLPGVPSEAEVLQKGTNLGEMDALLLKKIEELTLYIIELKKENGQIKDRLGSLEK